MSTITLKNVPRRLHALLKARAKRSHRSLNGEILACLEGAVGAPPVDVEDWLRSAARLRRAVKVPLSNDEIDALKREGRS